MAQQAPDQDADGLNLKKAWKILFPGCVQELVQQDSFGLGPTQSCTPDKFYDILTLWWNQELQLATTAQLQPNHLPLLSQYLHSDDDSDHKMDDDSVQTDDVSNYLGFYQPKNGTCGFVAAMHAIVLYKVWDHIISQSMEQTADSDDANAPHIDPRFDLKHLMASSIAHALITCAISASSKIEYDPDALQKAAADKAPSFWICVHCNARNAAANVFCDQCYKEPPPPSPEAMDVDSADGADSKSTAVIDACTAITIVADGQLPARCDENELSFYGEDLFQFKVHRIAFDSKEDTETATLQIADYLLKSTDFENAFLSKGSCVRILLSLIMTHGVDRCEYELVIDEYPDIFRQFRDESLVLGPYGFCSQNLVNLTMFGHCKPVIDAPAAMSYHYGFLGNDVINPGATGFFQTGYGFEYPLYPIWVVLSGTHYTTLFAHPLHRQSYNGEHVLDCYHSMVQWMTDKDQKRKDVDGQIRGKMKDRSAAKSDEGGHGVNGVRTFEDVVADRMGSGPAGDWKCDLCGTSNDEQYVFCSQCARPKEKAVAAKSGSSGVDGKGGGNGKEEVDKLGGGGWKCTFCGQQNAADHVLCANISCLRERVPAKPKESDMVEAESKKMDGDDEEEEEEAVHFELDLLCFNGLPPSGPLLAPISMKVITEKQSEEEKADRNRVIAAEEVLSVVDHEEADESKKVKYLKGHALVQRIESKQRKNVYFYEIAISLEPHFEETQNWKSPYFMKFKDEAEWKGVKDFFDSKILPNLELNKNYEYPSVKWRCCGCYLGDDMTRKYAGYNDLGTLMCRACGKPMYEGLRTLIVRYEHVPFYIRESKIDKVYQNALVKLLNKRFRNLVDAEVDDDCLPVI